MTMTLDQKVEREKNLWATIEKKVDSAVFIEWDGCHKIYIYTHQKPDDPLKISHTNLEMSAPEMLSTLHHWFDRSCGLRFITEVVKAGDIAGGIALIEQGDEAFDAEEDEEE